MVASDYEQANRLVHKLGGQLARSNLLAVELLVIGQSQDLADALTSESSLASGALSPDIVAERVRYYESVSLPLLSLLMAGCRIDPSGGSRVWWKSLEVVGNPQGDRDSASPLVKLSLYPALLLLVSGSMACIVADRYDRLGALATQPIVSHRGRKLPLLLALYQPPRMHELFGQYMGQSLSGHIYQVLEPPARRYLHETSRYGDLFDRAEYLVALIHADLWQETFKSRDAWSPVGRYARNHGTSESIITRVRDEVADQGQNWPPLAAGLFDGSLERFRQVADWVDLAIVQEYAR